MDDQTPVIDPLQQPSAPLTPSPRRSRWAIVAIVVIVVAAVAGGFWVSRRGTTTADKGTHTKVYAGDLRFGDNRAINACNVMPQSLVDAQFGANPARQLVQEAFIDGDVPTATIDKTTGRSNVTSCYRELSYANGGSITLVFDGFRNSESALADYNNSIKNASPVAGLQAVQTVISNRELKLNGVHNNFRYSLDVSVPASDSGQPLVSPADLASKAALVATAIIKNMDDAGISTHAASVGTAQALGGVTLVDPCQVFTAGIYEQTVLASDSQLKAYAKVADPVGVTRKYFVKPAQGEAVRLLGAECDRNSAPKPFDDSANAHQALKNLGDTLSEVSTATRVKLDYYAGVADAQHRIDVIAAGTGGQAVSGVGNAAAFGKTGVTGDLTQLAVRQGNYVLTILTSTLSPTCLTSCGASQADYLPLAKDLVSQLP